MSGDPEVSEVRFCVWREALLLALPALPRAALFYALFQLAQPGSSQAPSCKVR